MTLTPAQERAVRLALTTARYRTRAEAAEHRADAAEKLLRVIANEIATGASPAGYRAPMERAEIVRWIRDLTKALNEGPR